MSRPHRLGPGEYIGRRRCYLTICTWRRRHHFCDSAIVAATLSHILRAASDEGFVVLAYCFMPDHLHALVEARSDTADLQRLIRVAKQRSGFQFSKSAHDRLWQESYFDRTLRSDDDLPAFVAYLVGNPVRKGLASSPADFPHWGSQVYSREEILQFVASARRV